MVSVLDKLDEIEEQESGKGSYVCKATLAFGYRAFIQGLPPEEGFLPVLDPTNNNTRNFVKENCQNIIDSSGVDGKRPIWCCAIRVHKDSLPDGFDWESDRWYIYPTFTQGYKDVLKPSIKKNIDPDGVIGDHWIRLATAPDPSGRTYTVQRTDEDGNQHEEERKSTVVFIEQAFANEEEARGSSQKAQEKPKQKDSSGESSADEFPPGWTKDTIGELYTMVCEEIEKGVSPTKIASDFGITIPWVFKLKNME